MRTLFSWSRAHWPWLAGGALLLVAYTLVGFLLVPRLARSAIQEFVTQRLERRVEIGRLEFNPFTFAAHVTDLRLTEADGQPLVAVRDLNIDAQLSTIWHRALTFSEIRLAEPDINLVIDPSRRVNLAGLVPRGAEPEPTRATKVPAVRIGLLKVGGGRVALEDLSRGTPFRATITPIEFTLNDFRTTADYENAYHFAGRTQAGEQLEWAGEFTVQPLGSKGAFSIAALKAATLWAFVRDQVAFTLPSGTIDLAGTYELAINDGNRMELGMTLPQIRFSDFLIGLQQPDVAPWITVPELVLTNTAFTLGNRHLSIEKVALNGAQVDVWREADGSINLARLAGTGASSKAAVPEPSLPIAASNDSSSAAPPFRADVAALEVRDTILNVSDRGVEPAVTMAFAPVALTVNGLSSDLTRQFEVNADIGINGSGRFTANGHVRPDKPLADFDVELLSFGLPALQPYLDRETAMTLQAGMAQAKGHITYNAAPAARQPQLRFTGSVDVTGVASKDRLVNQDFLKWGLLSFTGIDYQMAPDRLTIDRILARNPYARVVISPERKLNVIAVLNPRGESASTEQASGGPLPKARTSAKPASSPPMPVRIDTVLIENGSADFADYSLEPSFATGMHALNGAVRGLSSNADRRAQVEIKGNVDRYAPVMIAGEVNLLSAAVYTDIGMNFSNMELTTFNPYSGKFAGYSIAQGKLTTELRYKVQNRTLDAEHHIVLDQLEFGAATESKDAVPLPIKLAVSLLKDRNGVIDINLPVSGTLDDPSFRLGPIIWKAVVGLLTRIVTAPFALLGSLFGGGEDLAFIDFPAGSPELTAESTGKLSTLGKALVERPQLKLDIPLNVTTALDAEAIAREALAQNVSAAPAATADDRTALQQRLRALVQAHTRIVGMAPVLPGAEAPASPAPAAAAPTSEALRTQIDFVEKALLAHYAPTSLQLQTLARSRADAVQRALIGSGEISAERVFLTTRELSPQTGDSVRMELKLE